MLVFTSLTFFAIGRLLRGRQRESVIASEFETFKDI
jgi:hypothetical protein